MADQHDILPAAAASQDKSLVAQEIQTTEPKAEYEKIVKDPYVMEFSYNLHLVPVSGLSTKFQQLFLFYQDRIIMYGVMCGIMYGRTIHEVMYIDLEWNIIMEAVRSLFTRSYVFGVSRSYWVIVSPVVRFFFSL